MLHETHRVRSYLEHGEFFFNFTAHYEKLIKETEFSSAAPLNNFTLVHLIFLFVTKLQ